MTPILNMVPNVRFNRGTLILSQFHVGKTQQEIEMQMHIPSN